MTRHPLGRPWWLPLVALLVVAGLVEQERHAAGSDTLDWLLEAEDAAAEARPWQVSASTPACRSRQGLHRWFVYQARGDLAASRSHAVAFRCVFLRAGERVYAAQRLGRLLRVHRPSTGETLWIVARHAE
jgi:hypothetical protein